MRVLITGGAGFIGSHLCDRYLEDGHEVICLDSLVTGRHSNVAHLKGHERFRFLEGDVGLLDLAAVGKVDVILHFACPASPPDYIKHPQDTIRACSVGTWRLLDMAREQGARVLLASTSEVYGDPEEHPQKETYWGHVNPVGVRSVYDESKRFAEMLVSLYHRDYGLNAAIVRIFNTYGPRMKVMDGRAIPNLVMQALRRQPLTVYGDGSQTRSFCYYQDLVGGLVRLVSSDLHEPTNLGNDQEFTILELAHAVREIMQVDLPIEHRPLPADDPTRRRPDISRARKLLDWEPRVPLRDGLKETIAYFQHEFEASGV